MEDVDRAKQLLADAGVSDAEWKAYKQAGVLTVLHEAWEVGQKAQDPVVARGGVIVKVEQVLPG